MKTCEGMEVCVHAFLTLALDGGEWSASRPGRFILRGKTPGTHCIGDWVDPGAGLDAMAKRKNHCHFEESKPCRPAQSQLIY